MATQYIARRKDVGPNAASKAGAAPIYVDSDDNILKMIPTGTGTTEVQIIDASSVQTLTNKTIVGSVTTNAPVVTTTSTLTIVAATHAGKAILLSTAAGAGTAVTLPAATGTGNRYTFVVGIASDANTIATAPTTDSFVGGLLVNDTGGSTAATADFWPTVAGGSNSNTLSFHTVAGGGLVGDWLELHDVAAATWRVQGVFQGAVDPATPFSHV